MNEYTQETRTKLLLLDSQSLLRSSLARLLAAEPGLDVGADCGNSAEALQFLCTLPVDVVLLDFEHATDGADGLISSARRNGYGGHFLILAETADSKTSAYAIKLGASGIFLKSETPARLVQAIRVVASGGVWLDQTIIRILADQSADRAPQLEKAKFPNVLTDREQRVLLGIFGGLTNKKIGQDLGLSESSVKTTVQQLFYRTGVRTRSQLVRAVLEGSLEAARELTGQARKTTASPDSDKACPAIPDNL